MINLLRCLCVAIGLLGGAASAHELRDFQAQGIFIWNYLELQLQRVQGNCPQGEQRAIALHLIGPLIMTGCWKRNGSMLSLKLENGMVITRSLSHVEWCTVNDIQCGRLHKVALRKPA